VDELKTLLPQALAELQRDRETVEADLAASQQELKELETRLAEFKAEKARRERAASAPPAPPKPALDPGLGGRLRRELLEEFGGRPEKKPQPASRPDSIEIWDINTGEWRTEG
jgi:septal ring factor EnvC (AmiA/AmiB activator)